MSRRAPSLPPEDAPRSDREFPEPVKHQLGGHRVFKPDNPVENTPDPNDVFTMRAVNLAREQDHAPAVLTPIERTARKRHWRDYALVMLLGNGFFGLCIWLLPGSIIFAAAGMIVLTLGVTWTYVFVIDPR